MSERSSEGGKAGPAGGGGGGGGASGGGEGAGTGRRKGGKAGDGDDPPGEGDKDKWRTKFQAQLAEVRAFSTPSPPGPRRLLFWREHVQRRCCVFFPQAKLLKKKSCHADARPGEGAAAAEAQAGRGLPGRWAVGGFCDVGAVLGTTSSNCARNLCSTEFPVAFLSSDRQGPGGQGDGRFAPDGSRPQARGIVPGAADAGARAASCIC